MAFGDQIELVRPMLAHMAALTRFFESLEAAGETRRFHPHPFTAEAARERCTYAGDDVYVLALLSGRVLGYGMLRGWDEGYEVPSLGIAVGAQAQGLGIGKLVMAYLHAEAARRGAKRIRLKVYPDNERAVLLYRTLGYTYEPTLEHGQLVGYRVVSTGDGARETP